MAIEHTISPLSRRAMLAGALGGLGAWAATAAGRATQVRAAPGDPVLAGMSTSGGGATTEIVNSSASNHTLVVTQNGSSTAIRGDADGGTGGRFNTRGKNKWGLYATNLAGDNGSGGALYVNGDNNLAIYATNSGTGGNNYCIYAEGGYQTIAGQCNVGFASSGVRGSNSGATDARGVIGNVDTNGTSGAIGVYGYASATTGNGIGVKGQAYSTAGWGVYSQGRFGTNSYLDMVEISSPSAPSANGGRIFLRDNGAGKTQLCIRFNTGATQVISTQP